MKAGKILPMAAGAIFIGASWGMAQTSITLVAEEDTEIREHSPNESRSTRGGMDNRSSETAGGGRQQLDYVRFNLNVLVDAPQSNAVLEVWRIGGFGGTYATGDIQLYGMLDIFGNTPQAWVGSGLTYNTSGLEIPGDGTASTQDLDLNRLVLLGDLGGTGPVDTNTTFSSPALDAFLIDRHANGGLATILMVQSNNVDTTAAFATLENDTLPAASLQVVGNLQALPPDTQPPTVAGVIPTNGATGVEVDSNVLVTFSEPMDAATITDSTVYLLDNNGSPVTAALTYNAGSLTATLNPDEDLLQDTTYTVWAKGGAGGVADITNNTMVADFSSSFTTQLDTAPPTVISVSPTNGASNVIFYSKAQATFDEEMGVDSITTDTFLLYDASSNVVDASVGYDAGTLTATLSSPSGLINGESYTAVLVGGAEGITDKVGNPLAEDYIWSFTIAALDPSQPLTLLPVADSYVRSGVNGGADGVLNTLDQGDAGGDFIAYIRFDLSGFDSVSEASLRLYKTSASRGDTIVTARHAVFGLAEEVGNTEQNWDESVELVPGAEYTNVGGNLVDTNVVFILDQDLGANVIETVNNAGPDNTVEGPDLVTFLNERIAAGGQATLIVLCNAGGSGRGYGFASKENASLVPPLLELTGALRPGITGIERIAGPAVVVTWDARGNHLYGVERTVGDLALADWVALASNLVGATDNTYTDTAPAEAQATYRVIDEGEIELFSDNFDGADLGWTAGDDGGTSWDLGTPTLGPAAAASPPNCYVTNLGADYGSNADVSLLSPVIDLTAVTNALLSFDQFLDIEGDVFDFCEVYARDDAGAEIPALAAPLATYNPLTPSLFWESETLVLPPEAQSRNVRFEFRFVSDSGTEYSGWYIDNVRVTQ